MLRLFKRLAMSLKGALYGAFPQLQIKNDHQEYLMLQEYFKEQEK